MDKTIAFIILTFNEEMHIERCINSVKDIANEIFVVDSFSKDRTCEIAESLGAKVYKNPWVNYATQFNWGLNNCPITSQWVWRLDADEYIEQGLAKNIEEALEKIPENINGIYINRKITFLGKPMLHAGQYPVKHMKIIKRGFGYCENTWMDEHLILTSGETIFVGGGDQVDDNLNDLTWWIAKHNSYSSREAVNTLAIRYNLYKESNVTPRFFGSKPERKRWLKVTYNKTPLFVRPFFNFLIHYFFKLGFLDGTRGFIWGVLHDFWYRFLVDVKIYEMRREYGGESELIDYLRENFINKT